MAISHLHSNWRLLYQPANQPAQQNNPATRSTAISPTLLQKWNTKVWKMLKSAATRRTSHLHFLPHFSLCALDRRGGSNSTPPSRPIENTNLGLQRGKVLLHFPFSNLSNEPVTIVIRPSEAPLLHTSPSSPWERLRPCETTWLWKGL